MSHRTIPQATGCLDDNSLAALMGGEVDASEAEPMRAHLDACPACHRLAAVLARGFFEPEDATLVSPGQARDSGVAAVSGLQRKMSHRLRPGTRLGRYVVGEALGEGGMGTVYAARDPELARDIALKVVTHASLGSSEQTKRLLREARAAAQLLHPNVVTVFDVGQVEDATYLAMELVAGCSLRDCIGDPTIPLPRRVAWLADVARALSAAHKRGLVHRDIKPENVMLQADGVIKVVDFGIARRLDTGDSSEPAISSTVTAQGAVIGTPMYMAPEQLRGGEVDTRCDQFAWGLLAYELLTGARPWKGRGVELVSQILSEDLPPMRACGAEAIPASLQATVRRAMAKSPAERFASMDDVVSSLAPLAEANGAAASAADVPRGSRGWTLAVGLLALVAIASFVLALRGRPPVSTDAPPRVAPPSTAPAPVTAAPSETVAPVASPIVSSLASAVPTPAPVAPARRSSPSRPGTTSNAGAASAPAGSSARPAPCDPPYTWQSGVKVPKPDCPLD